MRNKYPAECSVCHKIVPAGDGVLGRKNSVWVITHPDCKEQDSGKNSLEGRHCVGDVGRTD